MAFTPTKLLAAGKPGIRIVLNEAVAATAQKFEEPEVSEHLELLPDFVPDVSGAGERAGGRARPAAFKPKDAARAGVLRNCIVDV